ncbi:hypothetical protein N7931_01485 [Catenovulum sp. 2E275]|uniref:hypothetical protein n=1 Tax=Catenovulum sp. 2E275 TaxID=2980497 RepID=UPI0021D166D5|nr:hypothetical protein [Catenovulum sp. 2E275]MCU4674291.1 hypothetical protein [Catenovulum sp. 2E275]
MNKKTDTQPQPNACKNTHTEFNSLDNVMQTAHPLKTFFNGFAEPEQITKKNLFTGSDAFQWLHIWLSDSCDLLNKGRIYLIQHKNEHHLTPQRLAKIISQLSLAMSLSKEKYRTYHSAFVLKHNFPALFEHENQPDENGLYNPYFNDEDNPVFALSSGIISACDFSLEKTESALLALSNFIRLISRTRDALAQLSEYALTDDDCVLVAELMPKLAHLAGQLWECEREFINDLNEQRAEQGGDFKWVI